MHARAAPRASPHAARARSLLVSQVGGRRWWFLLCFRVLARREAAPRPREVPGHEGPRGLRPLQGSVILLTSSAFSENYHTKRMPFSASLSPLAPAPLAASSERKRVPPPLTPASPHLSPSVVVFPSVSAVISGFCFPAFVRRAPIRDVHCCGQRHVRGVPGKLRLRDPGRPYEYPSLPTYTHLHPHTPTVSPCIFIPPLVVTACFPRVECHG